MLRLFGGKPEPEPTSMNETQGEIERDHNKAFREAQKEFDGMSLEDLRHAYRSRDSRLSDDEVENLNATDFEQNSDRILNADYDALKQAYCRRISEACMRNQPVTPEEKRFLLENLVDCGAVSVLGESVFKSQKFKNVRHAASQLGIKNAMSDDGNIKIDPEGLHRLDQKDMGWLEQQSPLIRETILDLAKGGAASLAGVGITALLGGPIAWSVIGISAAAGVGARSLTRLVARRDMYNGLNEEAMKEMLLEVSEIQQIAKTYLNAHERGEDESDSLAYALNDIVTIIRDNSFKRVKNETGESSDKFAHLTEFRQKEKTSKNWEAVMGVIAAGAAGSLAATLNPSNMAVENTAAYQERLLDAKEHGIRLFNGKVVEHGSDAGHTVKLVDNTWRFVTEQKDIDTAARALGERYGDYFHVMGSQGEPSFSMSQVDFNRFTEAGRDLFHTSEMSGVPEMIAKSMRAEFLQSALVGAWSTAAGFIVGDGVRSIVEYKDGKQQVREAKNNSHALFTAGLSTRQENATNQSVNSSVQVQPTIEAKLDVAKKETNNVWQNLWTAIVGANLPNEQLLKLGVIPTKENSVELLGTNHENAEIISKLLGVDMVLLQQNRQAWLDQIHQALNNAVTQLDALSNKSNDQLVDYLLQNSQLSSEHRKAMEEGICVRYQTLSNNLRSILQIFGKDTKTTNSNPTIQQSKPPVTDTKKDATQEIVTPGEYVNRFIKTRLESPDQIVQKVGERAERAKNMLTEWAELEDGDGVVIFSTGSNDEEVKKVVKQYKDQGINITVIGERGGSDAKPEEFESQLAQKYEVDQGDIMSVPRHPNNPWKEFFTNLVDYVNNDKTSNSTAIQNGRSIELISI